MIDAKLMNSSSSKHNKSSQKKVRLTQRGDSEFQLQQAKTPRTKKSVSGVVNQTSSKYMQLQLQVSLRKRQGMDKIVIQKQKRITQLQQQIRQNQQLVHDTIQKWRQRQQQAKKQKQQHMNLINSYNQLLQKHQQLQSKAHHFSQTQKQNSQLYIENMTLKEENERLRRENEQVKGKYHELRELRRREKEEWRKLVPQFIEQFNKVKVEFLKIESHQIN